MRDWDAWVREYLDLPVMTDRRDLRAVAELAAHLEETWREARERGASEEEAEALVRATLGDRAKAVQDILGAERHRLAAETVRRMERAEEDLRGRGRRWISVADLLRDLRFSLRTLARRPLFAAAVVVVLALGIGATTAIYALIEAIILSPLPFPAADRLVVLSHSSGQGGGNLGTCAAWHLTYQDENRVFEELGMYSPAGATATVTGSGDPEAVPSLSATSGVFRAIGMNAVVGRVFASSDDEPEAPPVVLLGHGYWRTRFGGDREVVGRTLRVNDVDRTIIGVLPQTLRVLGPEPSVVTPLRIRRAGLFVGNVGFIGIARLKRDVTRDQAVADMVRMLPMALEKFPGGPVFEATKQARNEPSATPLKDTLIGSVTKLLWILMASVVIVLLIACSNMANLFLVRAQSRGQEMAVRAALGAGAGRIIWEHVQESVVLGALGGFVGLALAWGGLRALVAIGPPQLPRLAEVSLGVKAFFFALIVAVGAAVFVAALPVLRRGHPRMAEALKQGGLSSGIGRARHRMLHGLAAVQVALALVLLIILGLVVRSGMALRSVHPGFSHARDVLALRLVVRPQYPPDVLAASQRLETESMTPAAREQALAALLAEVTKVQEKAALEQEAIARRLGEIPGVNTVGMATSLPMHVGGNINPLFVEGVTEPGRIPPVTRRHKWIGEGYFETLGIPVLAGRAFTWQDVHNRIPGVVVSESLARTYWGSVGAAIGKRLSIRPDPVRWHEVIGVAADVREAGLNLDPVPMVYWPQITLATFQGETANEILLWSGVSYAVRSDRVGTPGFLQDVRTAVWSVNPNLPLQAVGRLSDYVAQSWARTSFTLVLLGIAGAVALVLGLVGVYGVISYGVSQRTLELGMRMVLGADAGRVQRMVLRHALLVAGAGAAVGLGLSVWAGRAMSSLLFGVSPTDPATFATVTILLIAVALAASYLPARRAAHVDPIVVLRSE